MGDAALGDASALGSAVADEAAPKRRAKRPRIDLDDSIAQAKAAMQKAQKEVAEARRLARNGRRKKQRLVKKAGNLSADDLERIAVLKRCGLVQPTSPPTTAPSSAASSSPRSGAAAPPSRPSPTSEPDAGTPAPLGTGAAVAPSMPDDGSDDRS